MFSNSSLKRHYIYKKGSMLKHITNLRRIVRVHCIFDTNAKLQICRDGDVAFGSKDLGVDQFEQRVIVFECDKFSDLAKSFNPGFDDEMIESQWMKDIFE